MSEANPLLPLSNERMACLIQNVVNILPRTQLNLPLWSIVGSITGHGSGYSYQICRELGFDPNQMVKKSNVWIHLKPESKEVPP